MKKLSRYLKMVGVITLFFFSWSYLPLFQFVAYAATQKKQATRAQPKKAEQPPAEKLEKLLDDLRTNTGKAEEKAEKGQDATSEVEKIKARNAELAAIDTDLKKEFANTEKRLKDANLSKEILARHYSFVKKYEASLAELRANLESIEKAKTPSVLKTEISKAKSQLAKVQPPKRKPFDPKKLPSRLVKGKERAPRLQKDEFERDFKTKNSLRKTAYPQQRNPILIAANGPLTGLLSDYSNASSDVPPVQIAQAQTSPDPADLAETPEIQLTQNIKDLAAQLKYQPANIYLWTRNNIEYVPTYGSIQGADMCLQTKQCNDFDAASLMIALFRASNIYAHYVFGTIEIPIEKIMNWGGGFSDPTSALNFFASGGIPITGLRSGGKISAARLEHVWVEAFIDYIPSFGAVHKQGDTWIPLDGSYKQYTFTDGIDFQSVVPFDGQALADQIKATATINEQESSVTNVNSALIQIAQADYTSRLETYVTNTLPNATPGDILGKKEIIKKTQPILPASLPYKVVVAGTKTSEIPDQLRHKITLHLTDTDNQGSSGFTYTASLPQLAAKRVTVSYDPATTADQTTINNYVEQYATNIPAYLVQFKPVLKIEGATVVTGAPIGMGNAQDLTISIISPNSTEMVTHNLLAGDYTAIGINPSTISLDALNNRINKNDFSEPVGEMLHRTALSYWAEADAFNSFIAKTLRVNNFRHPSELAASAKVSVSYIWGVPSSATYNRRNIDVKLDNQTVTTKSTDKTKEFYYMQQSGTNSSFLEGAVFDQLFDENIGDGISAITALKAANDQGVPIYKIDSGNIGTILPKLQLSDEVKNDILNAVNTGLHVQVPQANITKSGWTGTGYVALNPTDGTGAYRISGGVNGGDNNTGSNNVVPLPHRPLTGAAGWVVGIFASNGNLKLQGQEQSGVFILTGVAVAGGTLAGGEILVAATLLAAFFALLKTLAESQQLPPIWEKYRHYTSYAGLAGIIGSPIRVIWPSFSGDLGPGAYVTDIFNRNPQIPSDAQYIAATLNMNIAKVQTYVDIEIDKNRIILYSEPIKYPHQWVYFLFPIPLNGKDARIVGYGPTGN